MVYINVKDALRAAPCPDLGSSDQSSYVSDQWKTDSEGVGAMEALTDCFECTDWDTFRATGPKNNHTT